MFIAYERSSCRLVGGALNGFICFMSGLAALCMLIWFCTMIYSGFRPIWPYLLALFALFALFAGEAYVSLRTFYPQVSLGPNSALQNLPLLFIDLSFVVLFNIFILSSGFEHLYIFYGYIRLDTIPKVALIGFVSCRYVGLAWTDERFILKRIVAPIRYEKQLDESGNFA